MKIPMLDLKAEYHYMKDDIDAAIARCLEHQQWIFGPEVKELEDKIAEYIGVRHCVGTSSGTDALVLALHALAMKTNGQQFFDRMDLIITTPFTFTATGNAILRSGATPLFMDIDPITFNIDARQLRKVIRNSNKAFEPSRVVGVLPVHLYGQCSNMVEIMSVAEEFNLFVVEDCAQALGSRCRMEDETLRMVGSIGDAGCFSFFPSKNLGGFGDGGAITTNHTELAEMVRILIRQGGKDKYNVDHLGYNARLDTLQAAILLAKFNYLDEFNNHRRQIAQTYYEGLKHIDGLILPNSHSQSIDQHAYHQFTIRISDDKRNPLQAFLKQNEIDSMIYYPVPLHKMKVFHKKCFLSGDLVETGEAVKSVLSLPIEPLTSGKDLSDTINHINEFFSGNYPNAHL